jgi:hypothetical protein
MSGQDEKSPISPLPNDAYSSIAIRAIAEATTITLGVMTLAPLLECLMSHMGSSSDARRHAVSHSNQTASLGLSNLGRTLSHVLDKDDSTSNSNKSSRDDDNHRGPGMAVT